MRAAKRKDRKAFKIKLARGVEMKAANVALLAKWKSGVGRSIYDQIAAPKFWGSLLDGLDQPYKHIQDTRLPVPSAPENAKWEHNQRDAYVHDMYRHPPISLLFWRAVCFLAGCDCTSCLLMIWSLKRPVNQRAKDSHKGSRHGLSAAHRWFLTRAVDFRVSFSNSPTNPATRLAALNYKSFV
jgi:hypothetical protein